MAPLTRTVLTFSSLSQEYIRVPVYAKVAGKSISLASAVVSMAIITTAQPSSGNWFAATWDYDSTLETYFAQGLIGPGAQAVAVGTHSIWIRVVLAPETVIRRVGTLVIE